MLAGFGIDTVSVLVSEKMRDDSFSPGFRPSTLETTRHEMGHANYIIQNAYSYMLYLAERRKKVSMWRELYNSKM